VHEIPEKLRHWEVCVHPARTDGPAHARTQPPAPFSAPDPARVLVTASFGRILPGALLARFGPQRALNVHPSALPALRGPAPIQRALLAGARSTGVCVIGMTPVRRGGPAVDTGDVWAREDVPVPDGATFGPLRDELAVRGGRLLVDVLRAMLRGDARATPQGDAAGAPYAHFITPDDAVARWGAQTAQQLVWAHNAIGEQRPLTTLLPDGATAVQLHAPSVVPPGDDAFAHVSAPGTAFYHKPADALLVRCARGSLLAVRALKAQGARLVPAKAFWNGVRPAWMDTVEGRDGRSWKVVRFREPGAAA
jgi:methionyl-tRNA formyltransferase